MEAFPADHFELMPVTTIKGMYAETKQNAIKWDAAVIYSFVFCPKLYLANMSSITMKISSTQHNPEQPHME